MDDYVVRRGPEDAWYARSTTPASTLTPWAPPPQKPPTHQLAWGPWLIIVGLLVQGFLELVEDEAGFPETLALVGVGLSFWARRGHPTRSTLVLTGGSALFLSSMALVPPLLAQLDIFGWLPRATSDQPTALWGIVCLLMGMGSTRLPHTWFHALSEGLARSVVWSVLLYSGCFLLVALTDGFEWFQWFVFYFFASPFHFIWPTLVLLFVILAHRDFRDAPGSYASFRRQRHAAATTLCRTDALRHADTLAKLIDDLADGIRLSDDRKLMPLYGYHDPLKAIAKLFKKASDRQLSRKVAKAYRAQVSQDLRLLADDLEGMAPEGHALRVSPVLALLASGNPHRESHLGGG